jgi:hypothetical protein
MQYTFNENNDSSEFANQGILNDLSDKFDGRTPVRIHLLDNSSKLFLLHSDATPKDAMYMILKKIGIVEVAQAVPYFALYKSINGSKLDGIIESDDLLVDVVLGWSGSGYESAKIVLMIRLFMPSTNGLQYRDVVTGRIDKQNLDYQNSKKTTLSLEEYLEKSEIIDENLLNLQYIQAVYNIVTGSITTTSDEALDLAALHFTYKFGEFDAKNHRAGFLGKRIIEYIPMKHLRAKSTDQWEVLLYNTVKDSLKEENRLISRLSDLSIDNSKKREPPSTQRLYLEIIYKMSNYGYTFFKITQKAQHRMPENPILGVTNKGICIYSKARKLSKSYLLNEIKSWGYKSNKLFFFEIKEVMESGTFEFETKYGKDIADILTDYTLAIHKENSNELERNILFNKSPFAGNSPNKADKPRKKSIKITKETCPSGIIKYQGLYRGYALRRDWVREDAVILLQSVYRGHLGRCRVGIIIDELLGNND